MHIIVYMCIRMHVYMNICMKVYTCDICLFVYCVLSLAHRPPGLLGEQDPAHKYVCEYLIYEHYCVYICTCTCICEYTHESMCVIYVFLYIVSCPSCTAHRSFGGSNILCTNMYVNMKYMHIIM